MRLGFVSWKFTDPFSAVDAREEDLPSVSSVKVVGGVELQDHSVELIQAEQHVDVIEQEDESSVSVSSQYSGGSARIRPQDVNSAILRKRFRAVEVVDLPAQPGNRECSDEEHQHQHTSFIEPVLSASAQEVESASKSSLESGIQVEVITTNNVVDDGGCSQEEVVSAVESCSLEHLGHSYKIAPSHAGEAPYSSSQNAGDGSSGTTTSPKKMTTDRVVAREQDNYHAQHDQEGDNANKGSRVSPIIFETASGSGDKTKKKDMHLIVGMMQREIEIMSEELENRGRLICEYESKLQRMNHLEEEKAAALVSSVAKHCSSSSSSSKGSSCKQELSPSPTASSAGSRKERETETQWKDDTVREGEEEAKNNKNASSVQMRGNNVSFGQRDRQLEAVEAAYSRNLQTVEQRAQKKLQLIEAKLSLQLREAENRNELLRLEMERLLCPGNQSSAHQFSDFSHEDTRPDHSIHSNQEQIVALKSALETVRKELLGVMTVTKHADEAGVVAEEDEEDHGGVIPASVVEGTNKGEARYAARGEMQEGRVHEMMHQKQTPHPRATTSRSGILSTSGRSPNIDFSLSRNKPVGIGCCDSAEATFSCSVSQRRTSSSDIFGLAGAVRRDLQDQMEKQPSSAGVLISSPLLAASSNGSPVLDVQLPRFKKTSPYAGRDIASETKPLSSSSSLARVQEVIGINVNPVIGPGCSSSSSVGTNGVQAQVEQGRGSSSRPPAHDPRQRKVIVVDRGVKVNRSPRAKNHTKGGQKSFSNSTRTRSTATQEAVTVPDQEQQAPRSTYPNAKRNSPVFLSQPDYSTSCVESNQRNKSRNSTRSRNYAGANNCASPGRVLLFSPAKRVVNNVITSSSENQNNQNDDPCFSPASSSSSASHAHRRRAGVQGQFLRAGAEVQQQATASRYPGSTMNASSSYAEKYAAQRGHRGSSASSSSIGGVSTTSSGKPTSSWKHQHVTRKPPLPHAGDPDDVPRRRAHQRQRFVDSDNIFVSTESFSQKMKTHAHPEIIDDGLDDGYDTAFSWGPWRNNPPAPEEDVSEQSLLQNKSGADLTRPSTSASSRDPATESSSTRYVGGERRGQPLHAEARRTRLGGPNIKQERTPAELRVPLQDEQTRTRSRPRGQTQTRPQIPQRERAQRERATIAAHVGVVVKPSAGGRLGGGYQYRGKVIPEPSSGSGANMERGPRPYKSYMKDLGKKLSQEGYAVL